MGQATRSFRLRSDGLTWQSVDDQVVLLDLRGSRYIEINTSGAFLFGLLADGTDEGSMITSLQERYGINESRASADVSTFLTMMSDHGLLEA